ncbi:MAG TPA: response regulator transcription factor [Granulicella sp.]|jgi:DNA-binding NarL/FixJ family response regulator|nr:response regulator transcription factor [Granulicella sp.]
MDTRQTIKLLLLDDHSLFRESLSRLLQAEPDFEMVADYHSGQDALAALNTLHVDVVLLDYDLGYDLGHQNGLSFLEALNRSSFTGKVLFVTAGMSDEETRTALDLGASGIFLKHSSPTDLLTAIRRVAMGETWLDPKAMRALVAHPSPAQSNPSERSDKTTDNAFYTARERAVLDEIFNGLTNKEIAAKLNISEAYVKAVLQQLFAKTGVRTRSQLVRIVLESQFAHHPERRAPK